MSYDKVEKIKFSKFINLKIALKEAFSYSEKNNCIVEFEFNDYKFEMNYLNGKEILKINEENY